MASGIGGRRSNSCFKMTSLFIYESQLSVLFWHSFINGFTAVLDGRHTEAIDGVSVALISPISFLHERTLF